MIIQVKDLSKSYNGQPAVRKVSFDVGEGETLCLIGTSGCGKTTLLKMLNRLIEPTEGAVFIEGKNILEQDVIRLRRRIGYVMQRGGLFPHMTVAKNIGLIPRLEKWEPARIEALVNDLLTLVNLTPPDQFKHRYPLELSGGQQQRVSVARALAVSPPIILMDEPFGALDPVTRAQLQNEFIRLKRELKKTIIFVTHDLNEAFKLGDRIAIMDKGVIVQIGTPEEIKSKPASSFVETFLRSFSE